jgi:carbon-monoxide dehydrogenase large subunit
MADAKPSAGDNDKMNKSSSRGPFVGRPLPRIEDLRFVRGAGRYTDDLSLPRQAYAAFVRSPHAHARIMAIRTKTAQALPGVLAVLTGADYAAEGLSGIPQMPIPTDYLEFTRPLFVDTPQRRAFNEPHIPLPADRVRFVGEAVAAVIADSEWAAREAAERVEVDYEPLPAVIDVADAMKPGAPVVWPGAPDNVGAEGVFGDRAAVMAALASADLVVEHVFRNQRVASAQMEPRSALGDYDTATERYILLSGSQSAHRQRHSIAACLNVPMERVHVVCPDTGGGFGSRTNLHPEQMVVVWAARKLGRPVKWTSDRTEAFLTDFQGRDMVTTARLAFARDGRMRALWIEHVKNVGAQTVSYIPLSNAFRVAPTVYDVGLAYVHLRGVLTNTVSNAPFRGAGRPEATLVIERLIDMAAERLNIDRVELRRRNLIRREQLPFRTATGLTYDSGDFAANMEHVLALADWTGFAARRREARRRGRLRGIAVANYVETPVGAPHERVELRVAADGTVELGVGTQSTGQGHETTFAQVMADQLGVTPHDIRFVGGDTDKIASGGGSHSDRSMRMAGTLMVETAQKIVAQARRVAAALLDAAEGDVGFDDGLFHAPRSNLRLTISDIAAAIETEPRLPPELKLPLAAVTTFTGRIPAYPTGAAVCEVELDPETGAIAIARYTTVDDAGQPINPMILHGQVHGGIAQGLGQALMENFVWAADGQVLTASFMDYGIPRAPDLPMFQVALTEDPTSGNPLRVKGGGEAGITPALAVVMNAIIDALAEYGVAHVDMPATPARVWSAIQTAQRARAAERATTKGV